MTYISGAISHARCMYTCYIMGLWWIPRFVLRHCRRPRCRIQYQHTRDIVTSVLRRQIDLPSATRTPGSDALVRVTIHNYRKFLVTETIDELPQYTGSHRPHRCCPLANNVENINRGNVGECPGITPHQKVPFPVDGDLDPI